MMQICDVDTITSHEITDTMIRRFQIIRIYNHNILGFEKYGKIEDYANYSSVYFVSGQLHNTCHQLQHF